MKKVCLILLLGSFFLYAADDTSIFAGMRNTRFAFLGGEYKNFGLAIENSIYVQKADQQYARVFFFYKTSLPLQMQLCYALFAGSRYDRAYHDVGGRVNVRGAWFDEFLGVDAVWQIYNDSEIGLFSAYEGRGSIRLLREVALFAGLRTIPEYRMKARRVFAGLSFKSGHLVVNPEISTPLKKELQLTRVSVSFLYKLPI